MQVKVGYVVALLAVLFLGFGLVVYFVHADQAAASAQPAPQPKLYTETIDGAFTIPHLHDKAYRLAVPSGAKDAVLQGHFTATGGANNDIEVSLMDDDAFVNWQNRHSVTPIYISGRVTQGTLNVSLPNAGTYYLIFNNRFSVFSPKAVQDNVSLTYKH